MKDKLLVVAAFDSQLKVASFISQEFSAQGWELDVRIPRRRRNQMNERQVSEYSRFSSLSYCTNSPTGILEGCMDYSAILLMIDGMMIQEVCHAFYSSLADNVASRRPVLITGFVGVGLFDTYIGYQRRLLSDVLFLNAQKDLQDCEEVCRTIGIEHGGLVISGLPFLGALSPPANLPATVDTVLFAGQPDVPKRVIERVYVLERMIEYARRFPERTVYFKPRHKPGEKTLHKTQYHYETLLEHFLKDVDLPPNFSFVYGPIKDYLEQSQLFVTVSSTAAIEAMQFNCRVAIVGDLGITDKLGNNYFMDSGMLANFADLYDDTFPELNWDWVEHHMETSGRGPQVIFEQTVAACEAQGTLMEVPYNLSKLQHQIVNRIDIERRNAAMVRNPWNIAGFFLRRSLKEKRIL